MTAGKDDVINCYRSILGREPESEAVVAQKIATGRDLWTLIGDMVDSEEHRLKVGRGSPFSLLKFLNSSYLANGLTSSARASCLFFNYQTLQEELDPARFHELIHDRLRMFSMVSDHHIVTVDAHLFQGHADEGEISLWLSVDHQRIYVLTFTIVPADVFGLSGRGCFISRLQGVGGAAEAIRVVTKALGGIAPPHALVAVLRGIALTLRATWLIGVSADRQPSHRVEHHERFRHAYDDFFRSIGAKLTDDRWFAFPASPTERSAAATSTHRSRAKARRLAKDHLTKIAEHQSRALLSR